MFRRKTSSGSVAGGLHELEPSQIVTQMRVHACVLGTHEDLDLSKKISIARKKRNGGGNLSKDVELCHEREKSLISIPFQALTAAQASKQRCSTDQLISSFSCD